ncbi:hypothetical protein [Burkholderia sp. SIMBA_062]|uniref:hypothetical protein n=1 Tax=Burkholderia sp. SIMBA_062 TaxID=3085803 RepID=UPI00397DF7E3
MRGIGQRPAAAADVGKRLIFTARQAHWKMGSSIVVERVQVMIERVGASMRHGPCRKRD